MDYVNASFDEGILLERFFNDASIMSQVLSGIGKSQWNNNLYNEAMEYLEQHGDTLQELYHFCE